MSAQLQAQIANAVRLVQAQIQWRSGKEQIHLAKRSRLGHIPSGSPLAEYNAIIQFIVSDRKAFVYIYQFGNTYYPTVVTTYHTRLWLAMFGMDGVMETAFPPDDPENYFQDPRYHLVGKLEDILR
ncbi:MAG TPA: hypothetical protein PLD25_25420 [Chloroflexota bacterium]|nr:hypothetical protein [Chloroflexota bacterium]HUM68728.1 hypothetical protein [Chloroflexota bacterium]